MTEWLIVIGMVTVTYLPRTLPLLFANRLNLPAQFQQALTYVPIAVLSVIIAQTAFFPSGVLQLNSENPYLWGLAAAVIVALLRWPLLLTVLIGMTVYALAKWLF